MAFLFVKNHSLAFWRPFRSCLFIPTANGSRETLKNQLKKSGRRRITKRMAMQQGRELV
jgi:hypothetical protein